LRKARRPCVYILASRKHGTLYTGVTSNLARRIEAHRSGEVAGFAKDHSVVRLVYAEFHDTMASAITREKQMKKWNRAWKVRLISQANPNWKDLATDI
jgi:putative endonuclease